MSRDRCSPYTFMSPTHTSRGPPGWLILMGALTAIGPFAIDMYLPAFPTIAANLACRAATWSARWPPT